MSTQEAVGVLVSLHSPVIRAPSQVIGGEYGQSSKSWKEFLAGMPSGKEYGKTLEAFLFHMERRPGPRAVDIAVELADYYVHLRGLKKPNGENHFAPTSLRSKYSVFKAFWMMTGRGDLDAACPIIEKKLKQWESGYKPTRAKTFVVDDLARYVKEAPNNAEHLGKKVYVFVARSFAARGIECIELQFDDIEYVAEKKWFVVWYERRKQRGISTESDSHALITGALEVGLIQVYINSWKPIDRDGRFFRKLKDTPEGLCGTSYVIGKNILSAYGKFIATWLDLPGANLYTGHWPRRTTTSHLAEAGRTIPQIKCVTGHKSDAVVQQYIDGTVKMKTDNAKLLQFEPDTAPKPASPTKRPRPADASDENDGQVINMRRMTDAGAPINITINLGGGQINGALHLFNNAN